MFLLDSFAGFVFCAYPYVRCRATAVVHKAAAVFTAGRFNCLMLMAVFASAIVLALMVR